MTETGHVKIEIRSGLGADGVTATGSVNLRDCRGSLLRCCATAAFVFVFSLAAPVSVSSYLPFIGMKAAVAGNGDGNFGNGLGNGGPNGEDPGNSGGNGDGSGGDGNGDGSGGDGSGGDGSGGDGSGGDGSGGDDSGGGSSVPGDPVIFEDGGQSPGMDAAADLADFDYGEAVEAVTGGAIEGPPAGRATANLPTVSEVFSLGDDATVSAEEELHLIANGWNSAN